MVLYCRNFPECVEFYAGKLGLPVSFENDWFVEFHLTTDSFLSIANSTRTSISDAGGQGITLTLEVPDIEAARRRLDQLGIDCTPIRGKWGARLFYFYDPEGHRIECWESD
jgi:catechol 2,3-dioxygenase-like lactoylglutathione lyase family enzyme